MAGKYDDMLHLPHHQSERRPHMSVYDRAAQFSPFAALTGHEAAIREAERLTEEFREPDENQKMILDGKLQILQENAEGRPEAEILYFVPDPYKEGGAYVWQSGRFLKADKNAGAVFLEEEEENSAEKNQIKIPLERIREIRSELFELM